MPTLPTTSGGQLIPFVGNDIRAMDIKRRGMSDGSHVRYNFGPDGAGCTRKFSCAWGQRFNVLFYFVGAAVKTASGGISRMMPITDPDYSNWFCTKVNFEPYKFSNTIATSASGSGSYPVPSQSLPNYSRADFEAVFELVPFTVLADGDPNLNSELDRYVTYPGYPGADIATETQYISLAGGTLIYTTPDGSPPANTSIQHGVGFVENYAKFKVVWRRVPFACWGAGTPLTNRVLGIDTSSGSGVKYTRSYLGAVNQTDFLQYPALTLQLQGAEAHLLPDPTGLGYAWDIAYSFSHKPVPSGQLGFYYHDIKNTASISNYYQIQQPAAGTISLSPLALSLNDQASLFVVRDFSLLFQPF